MSSDPHWTPKVHPLSRAAEADDPYELVAEPVAGDPSVMLECIMQEFLWMGWSVDQLLGLFEDPQYPVLRGLRDYYGGEEIQRRVRALASSWGRLQFRETLVEPEEHDDHDHPPEPELVQISLPVTVRSGHVQDRSSTSPIRN